MTREKGKKQSVNEEKSCLLELKSCRQPSAKSPKQTQLDARLYDSSSANRAAVESSKEKSKRAVKRAQRLQRKKIFDKQLKDAKAKIVEEARNSSAQKEKDVKLNKKTESVSTTQDSSSATVNESKTKLGFVSDSSIVHTITSALQPSKPAPSLDLSNNFTLKKLLQESSDTITSTSLLSPNDVQTTTTTTTTASTLPKKTVKDNKKKSNDTKPLSRIVQGAASFGTNSNGVCPCNVKAMFLCKQCGSAWHGDCINSDKICISCS